MLTLWGRLNSLNVQKAAFALEETGVPYRRIDAGMAFGVVDTPDFRSKNPNGLIPLLEDGDFTLWESNVIVRYVAAAYGAGTLYPADLKQRAEADRWMDWQQTTLNMALGPAFLQLIRTPADKRDAAVIAASAAATDTLMALLDGVLATRTHIAGDAFTMGDIPIAVIVHRWLNIPVTRSRYPVLEAYYQRIMTRPAARACLLLPVT